MPKKKRKAGRAQLKIFIYHVRYNTTLENWCGGQITELC